MRVLPRKRIPPPLPHRWRPNPGPSRRRPCLVEVGHPRRIRTLLSVEVLLVQLLGEPRQSRGEQGVTTIVGMQDIDPSADEGIVNTTGDNGLIASHADDSPQLGGICQT